MKDWESEKKEIIKLLEDNGVVCSDMGDYISFGEFDYHKDGSLWIYHLEKCIRTNMDINRLKQFINVLYGD